VNTRAFSLLNERAPEIWERRGCGSMWAIAKAANSARCRAFEPAIKGQRLAAGETLHFEKVHGERTMRLAGRGGAAYAAVFVPSFGIVTILKVLISS